MHDTAGKFIVYSSPESQWANVPLLGLVEKGYAPDDYEIKDLSLSTAENFDPKYLKINPNGTIPSIVAPKLSQPLTDSTDILKFLDNSRPEGPPLVVDSCDRAVMQKLLDLVHSDKVHTNLILLQARNAEEMKAKQNSSFKDFINARQQKLEEHGAANPQHPFYGPKARDNGTIHKLYNSDIGPEHEEFFMHSDHAFSEFADGMNELEATLVLPYAAGDQVTLADLHIVPWLSHAMWGSGATAIDDFGPLERLIQVSVPDFKIGPKTKEWWANMNKRESFKKVFPKLH
ncbi:hypothetical protein NA57DRAFT_75633 [Rhizodiscina lignyota]|uniref:GST N-terminal domain-containing protein n=1 Tax=Rhizodiscina lignyota TaxID=1504668 RepID=A0A9P4IIX9_9PEZI|nr:hypothetical protein NA57DRAFT_75633 [Rhizodiscina lignyota]